MVESITKIRGDIEADRQRLLAGEILEESGGGFDTDSDEAAAYIRDDARLTSFIVKEKSTYKRIGILSFSEQDANIVKNLVYSIVGDDECKIW